MKRFILILAIFVFCTSNLYAQRRIFFGHSENSFGFKYFPANDYEKIDLNLGGTEYDLRADGLHLSWVGGPTDPRGRFKIGGGEGSVIIYFDPPIWITDILIDCHDYSFKQFSPGLQVEALVNLGAYLGDATLTGVIRGSSNQNTTDFWKNLQTGVVMRIAGGITLERLILRTYGYGDFVIHNIILPP